ncbi:hypothetical protein AA18889_1808 [Acetobacter senegalensis DSM 18889]|nr:hypothetical protein AA18889_1808 [Acetobacter senegalensis DSM 18889]
MPIENGMKGWKKPPCAMRWNGLAHLIKGGLRRPLLVLRQMPQATSGGGLCVMVKCR